MSLLSSQDIIENLTTAIVVMDSSLHIQRLNSSAEIMLGMSQRQAEDIPIHTLLLGESDLLNNLERVQKTGQQIIEREVNLFIPSIGDIVVDCAIKLLEIEGAKQSFILLELAQLDLQQRINRDENLHTQQQVLRGLAHEIKNPLGGLRGAAQLLERQLDSAELKEYTAIIISEADRLQSLMTKMLGTHQQTKRTFVNIHQVLQRVRQLVFAEVDHRLVLKDDYDPSIPDLFVNFDQLVQIFLNIVQNAVQALNGAGEIILRTRVTRNISIDQKRYRLGVCIDIEDNGPGISKSLQEKMFFPLVTGRAEGTGLGLYLVQNLVQRNNGMILCNSQPSCTVFSVIFPLEQASE